MTTDVLYTTDWNSLTRRPVLDHEWVDADAGRDLYTSRAGLDVVDALERDGEGVPRPRWVMGFGNTGVRVQFFDEHMSVVHMVDWDLIDGRLWRWITYDWAYSDTSKRWAQSEAILDTQAMVRPDGQGYIAVMDGRTGQELEAELDGRASDAYWLGFPEFGDWAALADPGPSAYEVAGRDTPARTA